jgi:hypothetical protein
VKTFKVLINHHDDPDRPWLVTSTKETTVRAERRLDAEDEARKLVGESQEAIVLGEVSDEGR